MQPITLKRNILIIDDDEDLSGIVCDMLEDQGYQVNLAISAEVAYESLKNTIYHLILLDINLPQITGFEICKELRKLSTIPIIFASARTSENDKVKGLDMGGDDYLAKPYSLKELLSRINSLIRRTYGFEDKDLCYEFGINNEIRISIKNRQLFKNGKTIDLSLKEFDLLAYMAAHQNETLKKEVLLREIWGTFSEVELSTVTVHIRWLREKLEDDPSKPVIIKTIWGIGYMLDGGSEL